MATTTPTAATTTSAFPTYVTETAGTAVPTNVDTGNSYDDYYVPWGGVGAGIGVFFVVAACILCLYLCCLPRSRYRYYYSRDRYGWGMPNYPPPRQPYDAYQREPVYGDSYAPPAYPPPAYSTNKKQAGGPDYVM